MYYCTNFMLNFMLNFIKLLAALSKMLKGTSCGQARAAVSTRDIAITRHGALGKQKLCKKRKSLQAFLQSRQIGIRKPKQQSSAERALLNTVSRKTAKKSTFFHNHTRNRRDKTKKRQSIFNKVQCNAQSNAQAEACKRRHDMKLKVDKLYADLSYRKLKASKRSLKAAYGFLYARQQRQFAFCKRNKWFATQKRTAVDFENIICTSSPQYLWVYFFHNQLPRCPPPSLASMSVPAVPPSSLIAMPQVVNNSANAKQQLAAERKVGGAESITRTSGENEEQSQRTNSVAPNPSNSAPVRTTVDATNTQIGCPCGCSTQPCGHGSCPLPNAANRQTSRATRFNAAAGDTNGIANAAPTTRPSALNERRETQSVNFRPHASTTGRTSNDINVILPPPAATPRILTPASYGAGRTSGASQTDTTPNLEIIGTARIPLVAGPRYPSIANGDVNMRQSISTNTDQRRSLSLPRYSTRYSAPLVERRLSTPLAATVDEDPVIVDLHRSSTPRRLSIPTPRPSIAAQQSIAQASCPQLRPMKFKMLPAAATVYNTQYYKPDGPKHCQLKTPYFPNARYPPVYSVYTTPSVLKFRHRNVVTYDEKTLLMDAHKPLSPIGARRRSLRSKTDAEQNTVYCTCNQQMGEMVQPCVCPDPPSEISCTCTPPIEKCSCQTATHSTVKRKKSKFPPDTRKILRRCITTGGGFAPNHINQFFEQVRRAIKKGRISKCDNPYCGKCYKHPAEKWYYRINRNVFNKTRCREDLSNLAEDEEDFMGEGNSEYNAKEDKAKILCDYTKGKKQYDTMKERELRTKGYNKKLEIDSEKLNYLLNKAFKLRKQQYEGEPCIKDSVTLYALMEADEELYRQFEEFNMHVPATEHELCPVEEEEYAEEGLSEFGEEYSITDELDTKCPEPVKPCSSQTDEDKCANLLSADELDDVLKRNRCDRNIRKCQRQRTPLFTWYTPLSTVNRCPAVSYSQINKKFKI